MSEPWDPYDSVAWEETDDQDDDPAPEEHCPECGCHVSDPPTLDCDTCTTDPDEMPEVI